MINLVTLNSPQQRNVVLHPEFVNGKYAFYTRPMDDFIETGSGGGIGFGLCDDITHAVIDEEKMTSLCKYHTITEAKNGAGATPIKTDKGWIHIAHGVRNTAAGLRYVIYAFATALDEPSKVIAEPSGLLIGPRGEERVGDVSNVVFTNGVDKEKIHFVDQDGKEFMPKYAYDPRLVKSEDTYYIIWCQDFYGAAIGLAKTTDFKTFVRIENPFIPFNRNAVLFPRKINGNYVMLSRPSDSGHTPFGDIFLSESPDMTFWGKHRHVMGKGNEWWESLKIGGGAAPIETSEGWLLFYHGVSGTCNGYVYSIGGAILDIDNPSVVKYRCETFLFTLEEWYEERGFVPNVCFPCATIHDSESGKIAIYYGAADSYVGLAFTNLDEIIDYIKEHSVVTETDTEIGIC